MAELVEERWKRGVQDRVYFKSPEGVQVGWLDLKSGREVLVDAAYKAAFDACVDVWARDHHNVRPQSRMATASPVSVGASSSATEPEPLVDPLPPMDAVPTQRTS
jgi:hypothetical protein